MTNQTIEALEARVATLEKELDGATRAIITVISTLAANDPNRMSLAERLRTIGDKPGMETTAARQLLDSIADHIETAGG
ncbi:MAG: hypothetical protein JSU82_05050 [Rhodospirillales bacterium]|nr:MAG: hypothetical protein JSU82_05050 [Rhodospirillales bacterium]